jgi:hypothetical protein
MRVNYRRAHGVSILPNEIAILRSRSGRPHPRSTCRKQLSRGFIDLAIILWGSPLIDHPENRMGVIVDIYGFADILARSQFECTPCISVVPR